MHSPKDILPCSAPTASSGKPPPHPIPEVRRRKRQHCLNRPSRQPDPTRHRHHGVSASRVSHQSHPRKIHRPVQHRGRIRIHRLQKRNIADDQVRSIHNVLHAAAVPVQCVAVHRHCDHPHLRQRLLKIIVAFVTRHRRIMIPMRHHHHRHRPEFRQTFPERLILSVHFRGIVHAPMPTALVVLHPSHPHQTHPPPLLPYP